jgi:hypothetical protein
MVPQRIASAVLQNPIGLHPEFPEYFPESFVEWTEEQRTEHPELDVAAMRAFGRNMWGGEFVFSVSREFVRRCPVRTSLLPGSDKPHPAGTAEELAELLPGVEVLQDWKGPEHLEAQRSRVLAFLDNHTPR